MAKLLVFGHGQGQIPNPVTEDLIFNPEVSNNTFGRSRSRTIDQGRTDYLGYILTFTWNFSLNRTDRLALIREFFEETRGIDSISYAAVGDREPTEWKLITNRPIRIRRGNQQVQITVQMEGYKNG